jgi:cytochrome c-type biogenesis protein CcmH/NrfG
MGLAGRLSLAFPAIALLAWTTSQAMRIGSSDSAAYAAAREISRGAPSARSAGAETMDRVKAELERANTGSPRDAAVQEMLGTLALTRARRENTLDQAQERFEAALHDRPTSPYAWASLAETLYRKGDTGAKYELSLRNAIRLGPFEPEVQRAVADLGLATWDESIAETRAAVDTAVANGMRRNAMETLRISERRGRLAIACRHLGTTARMDPEPSQICQRAEAT